MRSKPIYLIIHADDLGVARSVNKATFIALQQHAVTSASVMVPCPWFSEAADYAVSHPENDIGIHLTLTSEWRQFRWGPVAPKERVRSLIDYDGFFWSDPTSVVSRARPEEVELELRCQIEQAICAGVRPTHIDSHMFVLYRNPCLYNCLARIAEEFKLPFPLVGSRQLPAEEATGSTKYLDFHQMFGLQPRVPPEEWASAYKRGVQSLKPGLNEIYVHLGFNNAELRAVTGSHAAWGAAWRERDFEVITSLEFRESLVASEVELVGWNDLNRVSVSQPSGRIED